MSGDKVEPLPPVPPVQAPKKTGPEPPMGDLEYRAHFRNKLFLFFVIIFNFVTRNVLTIVWIEENKEKDDGFLLLGIFYFLAGIACWPYSLSYNNNRCVSLYHRYEWRFLKWTAFPYFFAFDTIICFVLGPVGLALKYNVAVPVVAGFFLGILNITAYFFLTVYECVEHRPMEGCEKFVLARVLRHPDKMYPAIRIVESSAFRIVLRNAGIQGNADFTVTRRVDTTWFKIPVVYRCRFTFRVEEGWPLEKEIILIPSRHWQPGAIVLQDLRSFGPDKREQVTTAVYEGVKPIEKNLIAMYYDLYSNGPLPERKSSA